MIGRKLENGSAKDAYRSLQAYFNGIFVIGMMAMKTTMVIEIALGKPRVRRIFEVTSSRTDLPNISRPTTAMVPSIIY